MAATREGNRKIAQALKVKYGVDEHGRSIFHAAIGSIGGENATGTYFKRLKAENPELLREISRKGAEARIKKQRGMKDANTGS